MTTTTNDCIEDIAESVSTNDVKTDEPPINPKRIPKKGMIKRSNQRESTVTFWTKHKAECMSIKSIKEVYAKYVKYCEENGLEKLNEYIFRTYIRKPQNGYCNSGEKKKRVPGLSMKEKKRLAETKKDTN
jgi:hypothetical protein